MNAKHKTAKQNVSPAAHSDVGKTKAATSSPPVWTIGHSTRPLETFLGLLDRYELKAVADVRRFPISRRHPQYSEPALNEALAEHGMTYRWFPMLGGRRRPTPHSPTSGWRNESFRGYADYMQTHSFSEGLAGLLELSDRVPTAIMCAEAMWWRCHRALIADALRVRGITVIHILSPGHTAVHPFTSPARVVDGRLTYPPVIDNT
jgi:uncharacterized protein (DUF488 family)